MTREREEHRYQALTIGLQLGGVCLLAGSLVGPYFAASRLPLWFSFALIGAILTVREKGIRMRSADWSVLLLVALEIPSLLLSQYRANSIRTTVAIVVLAMTYFAVRLTVRSNVQIGTFSGLLGLGGGWLALSGQSQFTESVNRLGAVGLSNLVAFRSKLISPPSPWIPGEWFTLLLLVLPFACVVPLLFWQERRKWLAVPALVVPLLIVATLCLSLSRAVFSSVVVFFIMFCVFLVGGRLATLRTTGALLGGALVALPMPLNLL